MATTNNKLTCADVLRILDLEPLPQEGGFYRQTYKATLPIRADDSNGEYHRQAGTAIYFLIDSENFSALHRVKHDEIFHYYAGETAEIFMIHPDGRKETAVLGNDIEAGERPQVVVPAGVWQGLRIRSDNGWSLMGTTVSPGFEFEDFEIGSRRDIIREFPELEEEIRRFTREETENDNP